MKSEVDNTADALPAQQRHLLGELVGLQMALLHRRLREAPWLGVEHPLRTLTMIRRWLQARDEPCTEIEHESYQQILAGLWHSYVAHPRAEQQDAFEHAATTFLMPWLERPYQHREARQQTLRWFGCFRWLHHPDEHAISLHIRNNVAPRSPFEDMAARRGELLALIDDVCKQAPDVTTMRCDTWLNGLGPFLALFPPSYHHSVRPNESTPNSMSWWGQFVTRNQTIHPRRAALMRERGQFELICQRGECTLRDWRMYMETEPSA